MSDPLNPPSPSTPRATQPLIESPNGVAPPQRGPPPGEKKVLTKAERREIQERQRAEKEALKAQNAQGGSSKGGGAAQQPKPKPQQQQQQQKAQQQTPATPQQQAARNRAVSKAGDALPPLSASQTLLHKTDRRFSVTFSDTSIAPTLRIFSHFGLPKPLGNLGDGIKGEIHPVIRKLGLQFADFRIVGANARCIATLTAFKIVESSSSSHEKVNSCIS